MTKSQGTSKAGEKMDWEKKIREAHEDWMLTEENGSYNWDGRVDDQIIEITRQALQQAVAQERERIIKRFSKYPEDFADKYCGYDDENDWGCDYRRYLRDIITNDHE